MKYGKVYDGDRVSPVRKGYKMMCCDCGLVHVLDFYIVKRGRGHKVQFVARRDNRATAAARRRRQRRLVTIANPTTTKTSTTTSLARKKLMARSPRSRFTRSR